MRVDHYTVPRPVSQADSALPEDRIMGGLRLAIAEETDSAKRQLLENAAALMEKLTDELQAYRDAAEYDYARPKSMQFRGWNMGKLDQARQKTQADGKPHGRIQA